MATKSSSSSSSSDDEDQRKPAAYVTTPEAISGKGGHPEGAVGPYPPAGAVMYQPQGQMAMTGVGPHGGVVVSAQPGQMLPENTTPGMMLVPEITGCPRGLEYLTQVDQLLCKQVVEILEAIVGIECNNRFQVTNSLGQRIFYAAEESDFCSRQFCGAARGFVMHILDNNGAEVLRAKRSFKCCVGCCWCAGPGSCAMEIQVEAPPGEIVGYVRQGCSYWTPNFQVLDQSREEVLHIGGPCCICDVSPCCGDVEFKLYTDDGQEAGQVRKQWSGFAKELFTDADNFGITFPMDLDVKVKATLLGAVFLINMMFFSKK